jgi:hypothetical protein
MYLGRHPALTLPAGIFLYLSDSVCPTLSCSVTGMNKNPILPNGGRLVANRFVLLMVLLCLERGDCGWQKKLQSDGPKRSSHLCSALGYVTSLIGRH